MIKKGLFMQFPPKWTDIDILLLQKLLKNKIQEKQYMKNVVENNNKFIELLKKICMDLKISDSDNIIKEYLKKLNQEKLM